MIRRPPRSTLSSSSAASDVYKRQEVVANSHLPDVLLLGALEPSTSPIVPGQEDIRASRPAHTTTLTGGSRFRGAGGTKFTRSLQRQPAHSCRFGRLCPIVGCVGIGAVVRCGRERVTSEEGRGSEPGAVAGPVSYTH